MLFILMQPFHYSTPASQVGLVGTIFSGTTLAWFSPLLERNSPLLYNFNGFMTKFAACFGEVDKVKVAKLAIKNFGQGLHSASIYASKFRQLFCDVNWGPGMVLISQFQWGLQEDDYDLLLTMSDATTLSEAIIQVVKCDNCLSLRRQEKRSGTLNFQQAVSTSSSTSIVGVSDT